MGFASLAAQGTQDCSWILTEPQVAPSELVRPALSLGLKSKNQEKQWARLITPQAMGRPEFKTDPGAEDPQRAWPILEIFLDEGEGVSQKRVYAVPSQRVLRWMSENSSSGDRVLSGEFTRTGFRDLIFGRGSHFVHSPRYEARALTAAELRKVASGEAFIHPLFLNGFKSLRWTDHFIFSEAFYQAHFAPREGESAVAAAPPKAVPPKAELPKADLPKKGSPAKPEVDRAWKFLQEKHQILAPRDAARAGLTQGLLNSFVEPEQGGLSYLGEVLAELERNPLEAFANLRQRLVDALELNRVRWSAEAEKKLKLLESKSTALELGKNDLGLALNGGNSYQRLAAARIYIHLVALREMIVDQAFNLDKEKEVALLPGETERLDELSDLDLSKADGVREFLLFFEQRPERMLEEFLLTQDVLDEVGERLEALTREVYRQEQKVIAADREELQEKLLAIQDDILDGSLTALRDLHMISERAQNLEAALVEWKELLSSSFTKERSSAPLAETFEELVHGEHLPQAGVVYPVDHSVFPKMLGIQGVVFISQFTRKLSHLGADDLRKIKTLFVDMTNGFVADRLQSGVKHHLPDAHKQFVLVKHKGRGGRHRLLGGFVDGQLILVDLRLNEDPPVTGYVSVSKAICRVAQEAGYACNPNSL